MAAWDPRWLRTETYFQSLRSRKDSCESEITSSRETNNEHRARLIGDFSVVYLV